MSEFHVDAFSVDTVSGHSAWFEIVDTSRYAFKASFLRWSIAPDDVEGWESMMGRDVEVE